MSPSDEGLSVPAFLEFFKTVCRQAQRVSIGERWVTCRTRRAVHSLLWSGHVIHRGRDKQKQKARNLNFRFLQVNQKRHGLNLALDQPLKPDSRRFDALFQFSNLQVQPPL